MIRKNNYTKYISSKKYYSWYVFFFLLFALFTLSFFIYHDKTVIYSRLGDSSRQHIIVLAYYGHYLRGIIKELFLNHSLTIPMFDMSIGLGGDVITTFSYYAIGDPFAFLSVFCPMQYVEYLYVFLIFLRIFCAGITFSMYCRYHGMCSLYTLVGSFIYIFSAYPLNQGFSHPFFINPMVYLPLLFIGVDKMLKKEGNLLYIEMIAISALSNFYFFYMLCITIFLYVIFRYGMLYGLKLNKKAAHMFLKFLICSLLGIGMSFVLFYPAAMSILSSSRFSVDNYVPLLYPTKYYLELLVQFSTASFYQESLGYTPLAFISVIVLFLKRREKKVYPWLCAGFLLLSLFLLIPWFGHALNGMAYVTNRWLWALAFIVALITVHILPSMLELSKKQTRILLIISAFYYVFMFITASVRTERTMSMLIELAFILILILSLRETSDNIKYKVPIIFLAACSLMLGTNIFYTYSISEENVINRFIDSGTALGIIKFGTPGMLLQDIEDSAIYRYDTAAVPSANIMNNSPLLLDKNGTSFYLSTTEKSISDLLHTMKLNTSFEQQYNNMDRRSFLDILLGAKYQIIPKGKEAFLPFGYNTFVKSENNYSLYQNDYVLPLCFTSDTYISSDIFSSYNVTQKQQALLQGIVVDHTDYVREIHPIFTDCKQKITLNASDGIEIKESSFRVTKNDATVTISFTGMKNSETYLLFDNFNFKGINPYKLITPQELSEMSQYERNCLKFKSKNYSEPDSLYLSMNMGELYNGLSLRTNKNDFYCGIHDFLVNMGYSKEAQTTVTITFPEVGTYTYDNLSVVCQPMEKLYEQSVALKQDVPEKFEINNNEIYTSLSLKTNKLVCFSVPYSSGWSAIVDGQKTEILKANNFCMALELEKGAHEIILQYETPYFKIGSIISIVSTGIFLCMAIFTYRRKKKWRTQV